MPFRFPNADFRTLSASPLGKSEGGRQVRCRTCQIPQFILFRGLRPLLASSQSGAQLMGIQHLLIESRSSLNSNPIRRQFWIA